MKKNLFFLLILFFSLPIAAKERSLSEIKSIAAKYLPSPTGTSAKKAKAIRTADFTVLHADEQLTVVGAESDAAGFVIVANDDAFSPVVGYSDGIFSVKENEALAWFVSAASKSMASMLADGKVREPLLTSAAPVIEPLLTSTWSQSAPFNNLCPATSAGAAYPCGCVATAMGQIMNYHKYPVQGSGSRQYSFNPGDGQGYLLSANFGETTYDWDNILDEYKSGAYNDAQANAVAQLLLHCGVAVEMQYTPTGSGAYSSEARAGLIKYFLYNENMTLCYRKYYSLEAWMNLIYSELSADRPLYYAGSDDSRGGHAFVLDGCDANGLVHINWGWGPTGGNGYFDITLLNPPGYSFSVGQELIMGIAKPEVTISYASQIVSDYEFTIASTLKSGGINRITGVSVGSSIWNLTGESWAGSLAVVAEKDGAITPLQSRTISNTANRYNVLSNISENFKAIISLANLTENGTYRIFLAAKSDKDTSWQLVRRGTLTNSYLLTISGGEVTSLVADTDDTWTSSVSTGIDALNYTDQPGKTLSQSGVYTLQGQKIGESIEDVKPNYHGVVIQRSGNSTKKVVLK